MVARNDSLVGRYRVEVAEDTRLIVSVSAPNVRLRVAPGFSATRSALGGIDEQTIFLDGAFSGPPFHDGKRRVYSLDHHEGCIRSVTLATCEQAAVVLVSGLPINEGLWTLVINEPDLDAILACWVLMNHIDLLRDNAALLAPVMPLLRTEGNIDTYGFGKQVLSALPMDLYRQEQRKLDALMQPIARLKASGRWCAAEYESVVLQILDAIDHVALPGDLMGRLLEYQEFGRVRTRGGRVAVLCRSTRGIYEVEEHLRHRYGKTLGLVVLEQSGGKFTIRRSDGFVVEPLRRLYKVLNRVDPNTASGRDGDNTWGGADDIGGSPRESGSALSGREVLSQIERIYGEPRPLWRSFWKWLVRFMTAPRSISKRRSAPKLLESATQERRAPAGGQR